MPPSQITAYARFYQPGTSKFYFLASVVNYLSPTRIELDASLDFTRQVSGVDGWGVKRDQIETPDYASLFTKKIGGRTSVDDSSFTLYQAKNGADGSATFQQDVTGTIVICWGGDVTGYKMDSFPVSVLSVQTMPSDKDASQQQVTFSITDTPGLRIAIP
ncbi:hypothetical protein GCM10023403_10670 [Pseudonocardia benzenivorans]